jgi:hypothetical protein
MQDVEKQARTLLSLGRSPSEVDAAIARGWALGEFLPPNGNERQRPTLRELQLWKFDIQSRLWMAADSWTDLILRIEALQDRDAVFVAHQIYDPGNADPGKRQFRCFIQHAEQDHWLNTVPIKVLFLDSTHGTNNYGMQLFIGATQTETGLSLPVFFFMCTVDKASSCAQLTRVSSTSCRRGCSGC